MIIIGIGSNLGDRRHNINYAIKLIESELLYGVISSSVYENPAMMPEGAPKDWDIPFYNIVLYGTLKNDSITPNDFLQKIKEFEKKIGRVDGERWSPRVIDIDIIAWGNKIIDDPALKIPHCGMLDRDFVINPLREILPDWIHPITGKKI